MSLRVYGESSSNALALRWLAPGSSLVSTLGLWESCPGGLSGAHLHSATLEAPQSPPKAPCQMRAGPLGEGAARAVTVTAAVNSSFLVSRGGAVQEPGTQPDAT